MIRIDKKVYAALFTEMKRLLNIHLNYKCVLELTVGEIPNIDGKKLFTLKPASSKHCKTSINALLSYKNYLIW